MKLTTAHLKQYRRLLFSTPPPEAPTPAEKTTPLPENTPLPQLGPATVEHNRQVLALIEGFIEGLPDEYTRQAVLLHYVRGLSWNCIALRYGGGASEESLKRLVYRELELFNARQNFSSGQ